MCTIGLQLKCFTCVRVRVFCVTLRKSIPRENWATLSLTEPNV